MKYVFTQAAEADLANIWDYTLETWGFEQARLYSLSIKEACHDLCAGLRQHRSADHVRSGYYKTFVARHALYFKTDGDTITIVRILHQSMDAGQHLR